MHDKPEFLTVARLKERGWTDALIRDHLGNPDKTKRNPHYASAAPMKLYALERIEDQESKPLIAAALKAVAQARPVKSQRGLASAAEARAATLASVSSVEIDVPALAPDQLGREAIAHYNALWADRGRPEKEAREDSNQEFLERIQVNYLRHMLTNYENILARQRRRIGAAQARALAKSRILEAIAKAYPALLDECNRQAGIAPIAPAA